MKKLKKVQQWVVYKAFLEEIKKLDLENKLPDIYCQMLSNFRIEDELFRIEGEIEQCLCKHKKTRKDYSHDSHYDYEDTYCVDCGKQLDSIKI
jgi:hypothetical protein